ncbi:MAG TPA: alpha-amylase family glycosyl hydrolase [Chlamydiales bacterium]|nr:MAG: hypothetical protein A3F67_11965 [Verrucomicrobia bacterium RIFCSPHIGHO2_12_FULL_41_10]HLB52602.1 alpha-amylase family glycosyl hydrolase [Chlamydiales bacterium]
MLGAHFLSDSTVSFRVWAPFTPALFLELEGKPSIPMEKKERGYFEVEVDSIKEGMLYSYRFANGLVRGDPVSRYLPQGPLGPTEICKSHFPWTDQNWKKIPQKELIFYECHIGTFTEEGTFAAAKKKIPYLKDLGINCLSLMPVAEFSGQFNWGYDWANAFSPYHGYGNPSEFKKFIDTCHAEGIAICLDVVYSHFGPEGCFLNDFGPYLTGRYKSPWGASINWDGPGSDEVRTFFLQNALYWIKEFHIDALRLDATHAFFDFSATPFIKQLIEKVAEKALVIVENNLNDFRLLAPPKGANAFWNDDFHHSLHVALTKERSGYYMDYEGLKSLKVVLEQGVLYDGTKVSPYRECSYGSSFQQAAPEQLISYLQNHDQIGNRAKGDRISLTFPEEKVVAMFLLFSPYLPLLFMGQEYGEKRPFRYFVDLSSKELMNAILEGRKEEFGENSEMGESAFLQSKLSWKIDPFLHTLYKKLIAFRKIFPFCIKEGMKVEVQEGLITIVYPSLVVVCGFSPGVFPLPKGAKNILLHTEESAFGGKGMISIEEKTFTLTCPTGVFFEK